MGCKATAPTPAPPTTSAPTTSAPTKVCTKDLKKCADGSFLSRDANCNFPKCKATKVCTKDLKKCADGSFLSRDANCNFPKCKATADAKSKDEAAKATEAEAAKAE